MTLVISNLNVLIWSSEAN